MYVRAKYLYDTHVYFRMICISILGTWSRSRTPCSCRLLPVWRTYLHETHTCMYLHIYKHICMYSQIYIHNCLKMKCISMRDTASCSRTPCSRGLLPIWRTYLYETHCHQRHVRAVWYICVYVTHGRAMRYTWWMVYILSTLWYT